MRPLYLFFKISLNYVFFLFYKRIKIVNPAKGLFNSTIYSSNHPNSFMDPVLLGTMNKPVVYFMTRSDVFKWWIKPLLWSVHMLPIYRQHDGADTKEKNSGVFNRVNNTLKKGRNILIFGEGFTDDIPVRSLKPIKKGPIRMGFNTLESLGWSKKIYVAAVGVNYTNRNSIGSEVLVVNGESICLNDFQKEFETNPNKTITELTKTLEVLMQDCVTYVAEEKWFTLHEQVMILTRKGMNAENHDKTISLEDRHTYSKNLATWINQHSESKNEELTQLKEQLNHYFKEEKQLGISDEFVFDQYQGQKLSLVPEILQLIGLLPLALIGWAHTFIPYFVTKKVTEKIMKRSVFWGSVKMMLAYFLGSVILIPWTVYVTKNYLPHWSIGIAYFLLIPLFWRVAYYYQNLVKRLLKKSKAIDSELGNLVEKRKTLLSEVERLINL